GYFLTRSWQLPDDFCRAVLWHHDTEVFEDRSVAEPVRNFVGIVHLAEHILNRVLSDVAGIEWERFEAHVLDHFGLGQDDMVGLADEAFDTIGRA
ncbi:hypothetical protein HZA56_16035, partial [Candidatus Poribacteria bacterium]|nr:hypothetical protein [Candidatus Poribacteria bacterium]